MPKKPNPNFNPGAATAKADPKVKTVTVRLVRIHQDTNTRYTPFARADMKILMNAGIFTFPFDANLWDTAVSVHRKMSGETLVMDITPDTDLLRSLFTAAKALTVFSGFDFATTGWAHNKGETPQGGQDHIWLIAPTSACHLEAIKAGAKISTNYDIFQLDYLRHLQEFISTRLERYGMTVIFGNNWAERIRTTDRLWLSIAAPRLVTRSNVLEAMAAPHKPHREVLGKPAHAPDPLELKLSTGGYAGLADVVVEFSSVNTGLMITKTNGKQGDERAIHESVILPTSMLNRQACHKLVKLILFELQKHTSDLDVIDDSDAPT